MLCVGAVGVTECVWGGCGYVWDGRLQCLLGVMSVGVGLVCVYTFPRGHTPVEGGPTHVLVRHSRTPSGFRPRHCESSVAILVLFHFRNHDELKRDGP